MATTERVNLLLCCNDRNGSWDGKVRKIDIEESELEVELRGFPDDGIAFEVRNPTERWQGKGGPYLRIGGFREITTYSYSRYVGNIHWDCATVIPSEAAELINYLVQTKQAHCTCGPVEICEKFDADKPITAHDLCENWIES
jgi:hypothetical protein